MPPKVTRTRTHQPIKDRLKSTIFQNIPLESFHDARMHSAPESCV